MKLIGCVISKNKSEIVLIEEPIMKRLDKLRNLDKYYGGIVKLCRNENIKKENWETLRI